MIRKIFIVFAILLFCPTGFASQVLKVRGHSALVDLGTEPAAPGDVFYTVSADGKRRGIIKLIKVRGTKAIAHLLRGRMTAGMTLEMRPNSITAPEPPTNNGDETAMNHKMYWGGLLGASYDAMGVKVNHADGSFYKTVNLTGESFSFKGLFDYKLLNHVWFRGSAGAEGFSVSGESACGASNNSACNATLWYLSFDMIGRYVMSEGRYRPWLGGGVEVIFPVSKSASALDPASISNTTVFVVGGGLDYFLSPKMYIPISLEYGLFPKSDQVSANWIALRAGVAIPY